VTDTAMQGAPTRLLAAAVLGLGMAACQATQREMAVLYGADRTGARPPFGYVATASTLGVAALVAGVAAVVTASEAMLATLVVALVALWALATARHWLSTRTSGSRTLSGRPPSDHPGLSARPVRPDALSRRRRWEWHKG
jgi:hypothetical protein